MEAREKAEQLLARVGLSDAADKKVGKYSRGMRQRIGLADVLIKNPEVIILDEPTLGIDPKGVQEFLELIIKLSKEEGHTVLLSSHHLHQIQEVCDRVGLFVSGRLDCRRHYSGHLRRNYFLPIRLPSKQVLDLPMPDKSGSLPDHSTTEQLMDSIRRIEGVHEYRI